MKNWVMLRGLGRDARHWYQFTEKMQTAFPHSKILPIDLPGIKNNENIPTSIEGITDFVRDQWLELKAEQNSWNLLAISLGGMIAIDWCHRYPNDFNHLVTINTSSKTTSGLFQRISPKAMTTVGSSLLGGEIRLREKKILEITTNSMNITDEVLDHWVEIANTMALSRKNLIKQLFAASQFHLPEKLKVPYTVLASKGDRFCHYSCSENIARRYNAPFYLHETGGHDLPNDDADWVIKQLQNI